jgi:hypothetical protein
MDLSFVFGLAIVAYLLALKLIPSRRRVVRFLCISVLFIVQTILIVALIGSPFRPVVGPNDLPRAFGCNFWPAAGGR